MSILKNQAEILNRVAKKSNFKKIYLGEIIPKFEKKLSLEVKEKIAVRFLGEPDIFLKKFKKDGFEAIVNYKVNKK